ncbi:hypothetical protein SEA_FIREBALL_29 [Gordonia phage Fireball]|uniref:Tail assembly chaperone n=1 Tax=Gordonia phage Fireball TaxID=2652412 RepID=A0A5P8DA38_9CAUD|nr:hypothetical protein KNU74_gp29 [Gordonia phage Fireball]QFP95854.1 hypothetical protein SEA_FIREBALL_29 [Gordonia phage Fireball]
MTAGPPWFDAAPAWSLDGRVLRLTEPSTPDMVRALLIPDEPPDVVPGRPAALGNVSGLAIVLACTPREQDRIHILTRLLEPAETAPSLTDMQFVADEVVSMYGGGMRRWTVEHLWTKTMQNWAFVDGELQLGGVDVLELPFARATALVWALWRRVLRHNKDEMSRFTRELDKPPLRVIEKEDEEEAATADADSSGFMALQNVWQQAQRGPATPASTSDSGSSDTLDRK